MSYNIRKPRRKAKRRKVKNLTRKTTGLNEFSLNPPTSNKGPVLYSSCASKCASFEGKKPEQTKLEAKSLSPENIDYDKKEDSKYGIAVFGASQTELGQDPKTNLESLRWPVEELVMQAMENVEVPYRASQEEVLNIMGMHIVGQDEIDRSNLGYDD